MEYPSNDFVETLTPDLLVTLMKLASPRTRNYIDSKLYLPELADPKDVTIDQIYELSLNLILEELTVLGIEFIDVEQVKQYRHYAAVAIEVRTRLDSTEMNRWLMDLSEEAFQTMVSELDSEETVLDDWYILKLINRWSVGIQKDIMILAKAEANNLFMNARSLIDHITELVDEASEKREMRFDVDPEKLDKYIFNWMKASQRGAELYAQITDKVDKDKFRNNFTTFESVGNHLNPAQSKIDNLAGGAHKDQVYHPDKITSYSTDTTLMSALLFMISFKPKGEVFKYMVKKWEGDDLIRHRLTDYMGRFKDPVMVCPDETMVVL